MRVRRRADLGQDPLVVAERAVDGAFIAAAFPSTETEETLFGDASDALRRQAEGVAAHGVDAGRSAMEAAAATAAEQGLSAEGLESLGKV